MMGTMARPKPSRRLRRATDSSPARLAPAPPPRRSMRWAPVALALWAVVVVAGLWLVPGHAPRPARAPIPTADPAAGLAPGMAFIVGGKFSTDGRHAASIPYFRRAAAGMADSWETHFNFAGALADGAIEAGMRLGRVDPVMRSSLERVRAVMEAMRESDKAQGLGGDAHTRAYTAFALAKLLLTWGFPFDALDRARNAHALDPGWADASQLVRQIEGRLSGGGLAR